MNTKNTSNGAGAQQPEGKSSAPDAVLRTGLQPKSEPVREVEEVSGKALECIQQQVGVNGNPKVRDASETGIGAKSIADANALKK